ncbi:MAG: 16S rRNA (guanine(527)-N(7))-methyltransferase RsmG [Bacteroidota bacterium]
MPTLITDLFAQDTALIQAHFALDAVQIEKFDHLGKLYHTWNARVNLISRKDLTHLYLRHILHSLAIAKLITFQPSASVLDLGTGGGLPGIPLAILFPNVQFTLIDSIAKKIEAVQKMKEALALDNVSTQTIRAEKLDEKYDFIVCRAVSSFANICKWTQGNIKKESTHQLPNGLLCFKGGDFYPALQTINMHYRTYAISQFYQDAFFATKHIVHLWN